MFTIIVKKLHFHRSGRSGRPTTTMYKQNNKRSAIHLAMAKANKRSISTGYAVVPMLFEFCKEKKSKANNTYYFCKGVTLNKKGMFIKFEEKRDKKTKEVIPFEPPTKRVKVGDDVEDVVDESVAVKQDDCYGHVLPPNSSIIFNTFDRVALSIPSGTVCKVSIIADMYENQISFKVGSIMTDSDPSINSILYKKYIAGTPLAEVPSKYNIDPASFPESVDPQYYSKSFVLPLSKDNDTFSDIDILVDPEDAERFWGTKKDDKHRYPSINTDIEQDKTANSMGVVFVGNDNKSAFMKFGYFPDIWECFGISNAEKWAKSAGRLIFNAKSWYIYGTSKLSDIMRMPANAEDDSEGLDFGMAEDSGYGNYGAGEDDETEHKQVECNKDMDVTTTGFIASASLDLVGTIKSAGIELPRSYVEEIMARGVYKYVVDPQYQNTLNNSWMLRVERGDKGVFNVTEFDEITRGPFLEDTRKIENLTFYGVFPVGNDSPYEFVETEDNTFVDFIKSNKITPSTIYAVVE